MIKRKLTDCGNDNKTYSFYNNNCKNKNVKDINKVNRLKWKTYLKELLTKESNEYVEENNQMRLKKK